MVKTEIYKLLLRECPIVLKKKRIYIFEIAIQKASRRQVRVSLCIYSKWYRPRSDERTCKRNDRKGVPSEYGTNTLPPPPSLRVDSVSI